MGYSQHFEMNGISLDFEASVLKSACHLPMVRRQTVSSHWRATTRCQVCRQFSHALHTHMSLLETGNV
jgi:hypothetical protein